MAYPTVNGPYGLLPTNLIGGRVFAGSTRMIPIASGYATSLYFGDPVKFTSDGTLITSGLAYNSAAAETGGTLGIFMGCEYTSSGGPIYGKNRYQKWTGGTVAADAVAYICDDPGVVMKAAMIAYNASGTPVIGAAPALALGTNLTSMATATANTGTTSGNQVGDSSVGLMLASGNVRRTTTAPFRIVGFVPETAILATATGTTTSGSTAVTLAAADSSIKTGMLVTGTGVAAGTVVAAVSGTSVTLSANATASGTVTLTFAGYQEVLVKWNAGYHAYEVAVAI
ncbi:MAG: hypothetical protein ACO395_09235 [Pontimonas sp.]